MSALRGALIGILATLMVGAMLTCSWHVLALLVAALIGLVRVR